MEYAYSKIFGRIKTSGMWQVIYTSLINRYNCYRTIKSHLVYKNVHNLTKYSGFSKRY